MNKTEIERVQAYMRKLFGSPHIRVVPPPRPGLSVEVAVNDEVIGTVYRDTDDGEVSYSVHLTILEEDLPPLAAPAAPAAKGRPSR